VKVTGEKADLDSLLAEYDAEAHRAFVAARTYDPLAIELVNRLENLDSRSAAVLRRAAYDVLAKWVDIGLVITDARRRRLAKLRATLDRSKKLAARLQAQLDADNVAPEVQTAIKARLSGRRLRQAKMESVIERFGRRPKQFSTKPTPERIAHAGEAPRVIHVIPEAGESSPRAHKFDTPLESLMQKLPATHYNAAYELRKAWEGRTARPRTGSDWSGGGRSDPASRLGITEAQQKAAQRWRFFEQRLNRMPVIREIVEVMILQKPGSPTPMEWAKRYGATKYDKTAKPLWETALRLACAVLAPIDAEYGGWRDQEKRMAAERRERQHAEGRR
jgi:hypothetical protein